MKLTEKLIYSGVAFLATYVIFSLALRLFEITSTYNSHLIGGVISVVIGIATFMILIVRK